MRSPLSQNCQHFLHNKPAKVENNLKSFQTVFILQAIKFVNKISSMTLWPLTHMMFRSRFVKCEVNSELQRRHRIEPLPVQKPRPESIVKQTTLMPLNYSRTYEV